MSYQSKLQTALKLQTGNNHAGAQRIYLELLKKKPKSFDARQLLALCLHEQGLLKESIREYNQAIRIKSHHAATWNNLGNVYMDNKEYGKAINQYKRAIKLQPKFATAHNNLGNSLQKQHNYIDAIKAYRRAILLAPEEAKFHDNIGVALYKSGQFDESLTSLQKAHNLNNELSSVYIHLFDLLMMMQLYNEAANIAATCIVEGVVSDAEACALRIGIAQICWLLGDLSQLENHLADSDSVYHQFHDYPNVVNLRVFHRYLSLLLEYRKNNSTLYQSSAEKTLIMISESHGFGPCGTEVIYNQRAHKVISFLITGCKLWHLAQTKKNNYKSSLNRLFSTLPTNCTLVVNFGEIDCRTNEGIYYNYINKGIDYRNSIPILVSDYVENVLAQAKQYNHTIIFHGVPAPHPEMLTDLEEQRRKEFLDMIALLNNQLKQNCLSRNCTMLDVYTLSKNNEGESNLKWHIDNIHMKPTTLTKLFDEFLISSENKCSSTKPVAV